MDWDLGIKIVQVVIVAVQAVVVGIMAVATRHFASKREMAGVKEHGDRAHHRLDLLEQRVAGLPNDDDIKGLRGDVADMAADLRENSVRVETAVLGVKRIEDYLIGARK